MTSDLPATPGQSVKDAAIQAAAEAIRDVCDPVGDPTWNTPEASAALAAAVPLVLEEAARRIRQEVGEVEGTLCASVLVDALAAVRSLAEDWSPVNGL